MDNPIRPIGSPIVRPVAPRRERGERPPFELSEDGEPDHGSEHPQDAAAPPAPSASGERAVAPPDDDEVGSHLDLSA